MIKQPRSFFPIGSLPRLCQPLRKMLSVLIHTTIIILSVFPQYTYADYISSNKVVYHLTIEDHIFTPATLTIPANKKVKIEIENKDKVAEEFDSFDLNREKVIFAGRKSIIYVGPLPVGTYEYFGEFHPNTARGKIIVVEKLP